MAMNLTTKDYVDNVIEVTAIKSKILLTENEIIRIALRHEGFEFLLECINSEDSWLRIEFSEIDEDIVRLRKAIGNLPDSRDAITFMSIEYKKRLYQNNTHDELERIREVINQLIDERSINDPVRIVNVSEEKNVKVKSVIELLSILGEMQNRSLMFTDYSCKRADWDGVTKLTDLFEKELTPRKGIIYFDQEFINYLKENKHDIDKIHWRNFERIIAEFFNKVGYSVSLGPGGNDGGIDIRVYNKEKKENGPPLIIIQCKRYKEDNTVDINTVKAFYADLLDEGAERGLIATTSRIALGGIKTIKAREYPIDIAEAEEVKIMINTMWRNHYLLDRIYYK